jgi:hypothetical protein
MTTASFLARTLALAVLHADRCTRVERDIQRSVILHPAGAVTFVASGAMSGTCGGSVGSMVKVGVGESMILQAIEPWGLEN